MSKSFQHNLRVNPRSEDTNSGGDEGRSVDHRRSAQWGRFACGSNVILDKYNKGTLTATEKDKRYDESAVKSPGSTDAPGVEPLDVTPDKIDIDERLVSVLGHERAIASAADPDSRKRLSFGLSEAVLPSKGVAVR